MGDQNDEWEAEPENNGEWEQWPAEAGPGAEADAEAGPEEEAEETRKDILSTPLTDAQRAILSTPPSGPFTILPEADKTAVETCLDRLFPSDMLPSVFPGQTTATFLPWFRSLLQRHRAIIAGGFVLRAIVNQESADPCEIPAWDRPDLDIYVPCETLVDFYKELLPIYQPDSYERNVASHYCRSFLRRNGIRTVLRFKRTGGTLETIDIMAVRNARTPVDVVQNFDLTFCQVWYDGENVYATHPDHLKHKVGYLQGEYVKLFLRRNHFLRRRVNKYRSRGFTVALDPVALEKLVPSDLMDMYELTKIYTLEDEKLLISPDRCGTPRTGLLHTRKFFDRWAMRVLLNSVIKEALDKYKLDTLTVRDAIRQLGWDGLYFFPETQRYPDTCVKKYKRRLSDPNECDKLPVKFKSGTGESQLIELDHANTQLDPLDGYDTDQILEEDNRTDFLSFLYSVARENADSRLKPISDEDLQKETKEACLKTYLTIGDKYYQPIFSQHKEQYINALEELLESLGYNCIGSSEETSNGESSNENEESKSAEEESPAPPLANNTPSPRGLFGNTNAFGGYKKTRKRKQRKVK